MKRWLVSAAVFALSSSVQAQSTQSESNDVATPTPVEVVLAASSEAARSRSYVGLANWSNGLSETNIKIFHRVEDGVETERIVHLDGVPREVVRAPVEVDCVHPGQALRRARFNRSLEMASDQYHADITGESRVANRPVWQVRLMPVDEYRYAHLLYIDKSTGLVIKSMMVDGEGKVLESLQFLDLSIREVQPSEVEPSGVHAVEFETPADQCVRGGLANYDHVDWAVTDLPNGYELFSAEYDEENARTWLVYGDGFSVFSVFVEPGELVRGLRQVGAMAFYSQPVDVGGSPYTVTIMGDVPVATIERAMATLRKRTD